MPEKGAIVMSDYSLEGSLEGSHERSLDGALLSPLGPEASYFSQKALVLALILVSLQLLDGILTAFGISVFGTGMEGNLLVRFFMLHLGHISALCLVKGFAISAIFLLFSLSARIRWIPAAMQMLIAVYFFGAILPWGYILFPEVF